MGHAARAPFLRKLGLRSFTRVPDVGRGGTFPPDAALRTFSSDGGPPSVMTMAPVLVARTAIGSVGDVARKWGDGGESHKRVGRSVASNAMEGQNLCRPWRAPCATPAR